MRPAAKITWSLLLQQVVVVLWMHGSVWSHSYTVNIYTLRGRVINTPPYFTFLPRGTLIFHFPGPSASVLRLVAFITYDAQVYFGDYRYDPSRI